MLRHLLKAIPHVFERPSPGNPNYKGVYNCAKCGLRCTWLVHNWPGHPYECDINDHDDSCCVCGEDH